MTPEYNRDEVAFALGVCPETLPHVIEPLLDSETSDRFFVPLDDHEWNVLAPLLPKLPVPKPLSQCNDRVFLDAIMWWCLAQRRGYSWHRLPAALGPESSRSHRHRRWVMLGYWTALADKLEAKELLSPERRRLFRWIADDAERRKVVLIDRRSRLTDVR